MAMNREKFDIGVLIIERAASESAARLRALAELKQLKILSVLDRVDTAIAWLDAHAPDVMITDLDFTDGCGLAIVEKCMHRHPACKILVLVGSELIHSAHAAIEAGASGFLVRGMADGCVVVGVSSMLEGGFPISALVARQLFERFRGPVRASKFIGIPAPDRTRQPLTRREAQVLQHLASGDMYEEISASLGITLGTLQSHVKSLYRKLDVHSRSEATFRSREYGIVAHAARHHPGRQIHVKE